jgi:hypothetical protein
VGKLASPAESSDFSGEDGVEEHARSHDQTDIWLNLFSSFGLKIG